MPKLRMVFRSLSPLLLLFFVSACASQPVAPQTQAPVLPATSSSDDPCLPQNLPTIVQPINDLMREFEEASQLAPNINAQQLPEMISKLQGIRREAEDVQIPTCLGSLKTHQLKHMNLTIQALLAFVGGADQESLNQGLEEARKEHELYSLEIVRLMGVTFAPVTATATLSNTP